MILISYDLRVPGRYEELYQIIKTADSWTHIMESFWLVRTTEPVRTWYERLRSVMGPDDSLFVAEINESTRCLPDLQWYGNNNLSLDLVA